MENERTIHSVDISTIAHATEDLDKVNVALRTLLPEALRQREVFTRRYMQGHHNNPIVTCDAKFTRRAEVEQFVGHFMSRLAKNERLLIERDLDLYSDEEGNLYIRIDKQQAFRGTVELGNEDPIRVRLKFTRLMGDSKALMKQLLESD